MQAIQVVKLADPTVPDGALKAVEVPIPTPAKDQVVVEVTAASINFADVLQAQVWCAFVLVVMKYQEMQLCMVILTIYNPVPGAVSRATPFAIHTLL